MPAEAPELLEKHGIPAGPEEYSFIYRAAVESIRGTFSATMAEKRRFTEGILDHLRAADFIADWKPVGSARRQDYSVELSDGFRICIEAKGAGDGQNTNVWDRPPWADEFIIWSQNPGSFGHHPGHGVWAALASRLFPKILVERQNVDAFIFFDGRCGSAQRPCPKQYGISGPLRKRVTGIPAEDGRDWLPPPSIFLMPRSVVHPEDNPNPPLHSARTCRFAGVLLAAFGVPAEEENEYLNWARVEAKRDGSGTYIRVSVGQGLGSQPAVQSQFKRVRRTT